MTEELENEKRRKNAYSLGATLLVLCFLILWYVLYEDTKDTKSSESKLILCGLSAFILATVGCWFVILLFLSGMTYEAYKYFSQRWHSFSFDQSFVYEVLRQYVMLIDRGMPKTPHKIIILSFILVVGWALVFYGMSKPEESQKSQESEISS